MTDMIEEPEALCDECKRAVVADLIIPCWAWTLISPSGDLGGFLCPNCILERLTLNGIHCECALMGPSVTAVSQAEMTALRRVENIELALEGFRNRWGAALDDRIREGGIEPRPSTTQGEL